MIQFKAFAAYPTGDCGWEEEWNSKEESIIGFNEMIEAIKEECEPEEIDYCKLYSIDEAGNYQSIMFWSFDNGFTEM